MGATNATASSSSSRRRRAAVKSRSRSAVACCLLAAGGAFAQTTVAAPGQPEHSGTPNAFQVVGDSVASAQQVCSSTDATFTLVYSSSIMRRCFWADRIVFTSWTRRKTTRRRSRATLRGQPVRFFTFFNDRARVNIDCVYACPQNTRQIQILPVRWTWSRIRSVPYVCAILPYSLCANLSSRVEGC